MARLVGCYWSAVVRIYQQWSEEGQTGKMVFIYRSDGTTSSAVESEESSVIFLVPDTTEHLQGSAHGGPTAVNVSAHTFLNLRQHFFKAEITAKQYRKKIKHTDYHSDQIIHLIC